MAQDFFEKCLRKDNWESKNIPNLRIRWADLNEIGLAGLNSVGIRI